MKKLTLSLIITFYGLIISAQTNIFPLEGKVGIGTNNPEAKLHIFNNDITNLTTLNINTNGITGYIVDTTYGIYVVNNFGGSYNGPRRIGGYFESKSYTSSNNYTYGVIGVGNAVGGYGHEAIGIVGIAKHSYFHYNTNRTKLIGVKGLVEFSDDNILINNTSYGASLMGEANVPTNKSLNTYYGLFLKTPFGNITNKWGIYQQDINSINYFSGNVGIGTTEMGTHKLVVDGTIGAREIKVEAGTWSDFVFNENYELKDLTEVENFIEKNNHLPDIPSEKDVLVNGIQLGAMDAKLLQKIEELTLYMIDINKRVLSLETENSTLKEKINKLESAQ